MGDQFSVNASNSSNISLSKGDNNQITQTVNSVQEPNDFKELVIKLSELINTLDTNANPTQVKRMKDDLKILREKMEEPEPDTRWYSLSLEGIMKAATAIGKTAEPILNTVQKLLDIL